MLCGQAAREARRPPGVTWFYSVLLKPSCEGSPGSLIYVDPGPISDQIAQKVQEMPFLRFSAGFAAFPALFALVQKRVKIGPESGSRNWLVFSVRALKKCAPRGKIHRSRPFGADGRDNKANSDF